MATRTPGRRVGLGVSLQRRSSTPPPSALQEQGARPAGVRRGPVVREAVSGSLSLRGQLSVGPYLKGNRQGNSSKNSSVALCWNVLIQTIVSSKRTSGHVRRRLADKMGLPFPALLCGDVKSLISRIKTLEFL